MPRGKRILMTSSFPEEYQYYKPPSASHNINMNTKESKSIANSSPPMHSETVLLENSQDYTKKLKKGG